MRRIACLFALSLASPASAALLAEIKHQNSEPFHVAGDTTASFRFTAWGTYSNTVTMGDVGKTLSAPPELLPDFQFGLTRQEPFDLILHFNSREDRAPSSTLTMDVEPFPPIVVVDRFAPIRGPALFGYTITGITRTIDRFDAVPVSGELFTHFGAQTIRIFGDPIPEPHGIALVGIAAAIWRSFAQRSRRRSQLV